MSARKISAGDTIEARCTKCRDLLNHTIVAMVGDRVVRVQCNTCGGQHNYHPPVKEKSPAERETTRRAPAAVKPRKEPVPAGPTEWERTVAGMDQESAVPYDMNGSFKQGGLVNHPAFGLGIVTAVMKPNKVEILFQSGKKLLRCAM